MAGLVGGVARAIYSGSGVIPLPRKINGHLKLGFLAGGFLGAVMAVIFDGSYVTAILSGFTFPEIVERELERRKNRGQ